MSERLVALTDPRHAAHSSANGPRQQRHAGHRCVGGFVAVAVVVGHGVHSGETRQANARHMIRSTFKVLAPVEIDRWAYRRRRL